jgi:hypothetical protein
VLLVACVSTSESSATTPSCWLDQQTRRRQHAIAQARVDIEQARADGVATSIKRRHLWFSRRSTPVPWSLGNAASKPSTRNRFMSTNCRDSSARPFFVVTAAERITMI